MLFLTRVSSPFLLFVLLAQVLPSTCQEDGVITIAANVTDDATPNDDIFATGTPIQTMEPGIEFYGPGVVTCPFDDYLYAACVPEFFTTLEECGSIQACAQIVTPPTNATHINIAIPCECMKMTGCASSCTFTNGTNAPVPQTGVDFTGPGYVSCPAEDYTLLPCYAFELNEDCVDPTACGIGSIPIGDSTYSNILVPLPCDCLTAKNCPTTCTFMPGDIPDNITGVPISTEEPMPTPSPMLGSATSYPTGSPTMAGSDMNSGDPATIRPSSFTMAPTIASPHMNTTAAPSSVAMSGIPTTNAPQQQQPSTSSNAPMASPLMSINVSSAPISSPMLRTPSSPSAPAVVPPTNQGTTSSATAVSSSLVGIILVVWSVVML